MCSEEMKKELQDLKKQRTQLRRVFTVAVNKFREAYERKANLDELSTLFAQFSDKSARLLKIEDSVGALVLSVETDESTISNQFDEAEGYRDVHSEIVAKWELVNQQEKDDVSSTASSATGRKKSSLKLPKIVPYQFDGQLKNWISFWSVFKRIDQSDEYDDSEKFQYLLMYTKEGSSARELVESFPPLDKNYAKAVARLKARFGKDELLIEMYMRELLSLVLLQTKGESTHSLRKLYDQLETQIKALESLGVASEKYTYLLTPLIESALPDHVLKDWERESRAKVCSKEDCIDDLETKFSDLFVKDTKSSIKEDKLQRLLSFLRDEVEREECLLLKRSAFQDSSKPVGTSDEKSLKGKAVKGESSTKLTKSKCSKKTFPTAAGLVNIKEGTNLCIFCCASHASEVCVKCYDLKAAEVRQKLSENGHCFLCFKKGHSKIQCRAVIRCVICSKRHNPVLCEDRQVKPPDKAETGQNGALHHNLSNTHHCPILLQTLRVTLRGKRDIEARVMIDCGSQKSYVTHRVLSQLDYMPTRTESLTHALFGGTLQPQVHKCYKLKLASLDKAYGCNFDVLSTETICLAVPAPTNGDWLAELKQKGIQLTDRGAGPIDVLIGADVAGKLWTGRREVLSCGLVAIETLLGWTLMGKTTGSTTATCDTHISMMCAEASPSNLWRLDILGIEDPAQKFSKEQSLELTKNEFAKTVKILGDGRYQVNLPWRDDHPPLQRNFELATLRFDRAARKLKALGREKAYLNVLLDWLNEGIIEEVPCEKWNDGHYLPHRAVYKENSTTPLRPVFDASASEKGHPSLNQCLDPGPNLIEQIPPILTRFRKGKFGLVADVKRAFLNISLDETDRDFLRFLWKDDNGLRIFRHCRVVFGVCCSPFLLGAVFEHHFGQCEILIENGDFDCLQDVINQLRRSMYVDNYVGSHRDLTEVESFTEHARSTFARACFDLRGWERTNTALPSNTETSVLGVVWDQKGDTLRLKNPDFSDISGKRISKRILSSAAHRLFDPMGLTSPVLVAPKRLFQKAARSGGSWDKLVDEESEREIFKWINEVPLLSAVEIPRWFTNYGVEGASVSLHTFCDASQLAYAAVIFLRIDYQGEVSVVFVSAKSRIAPPEKITIPRLELLAAVVGARLAHGVLECLEDVHEEFYWSDSSTALCWIQKEEPWAVFVGNRVKEIRLLTDPTSWRHVPGILNPADLASRGCSPKVFVQSQWWEGPPWLKLSKEKWPNSSITMNEDEVLAERRKTAVMALNTPKSWPSMEFAKRFSSYFPIVRVVAWILRFYTNARKGVRTKKTQKTRNSGDLSPLEITNAERKLLVLVQSESFPQGEKEKAITRLKPKIDTQGLIRLRTKIWARKDSEDFRSPILLSPEHPLTNILMRSVHLENKHIAGHGLLNILREKYWILRGKQAVRRTVKQCVPCQRVYSRNLDTESPPLPEDRVRDACIFEVIGTDLAGPLFLRDGSKVWLVIFTCAIFRAVHLDLITSQSTEGFILALRRFIARRGRPSIIFSDNGGNFKKTANALHSLDWERIRGQFRTQPIEWRFNPPTGSWWGGFYERLIGLVKVLLKKNLGRASLEYAELYTLICECEVQINDRPITYMSDANDGTVPISPSMFIREIREAGIPDLEEIDSAGFEKRLRYRQRVKQELRERFRSDYLSQLVCSNEKRKETRQPVVGELVLIGSDTKKRLEWPLGVVKELLRGKDGKCRVVKLQTREGELLRPIQRIFPLEVFSSEDSWTKKPEEVVLSEEDEEKIPAEVATPPKEVGPPEDPASDITESKSREINKEITTRCGRKVILPLKLR